ncbi:FUSC family protein [Nakamurella aerolata]|uniref:Integral membrane bound transporter domain-containing protein n=1 Tax=Nakamurella aerolata TaxID=1656892 RepID=A0A849A7R6_9ACTN|nr:hypothetical protein [Nakamurella aerolata]
MSLPVSPGAQWRREMLRRGRTRVQVERRDLKDRIGAADPGGVRLHMAFRVVVAIAAALALERLWSAVTGIGAAPVMLLGAVVAMLTASGIRENTRQRTFNAAWPVLPAAVLGGGAATLTSGVKWLTLVLFVVVSFVAVWIRRFGPAWLTYGMVGWQSYFFILFLGPPIHQFPIIIGALALSAVSTTLLLCTVLYQDPAKRLRRTIAAYRARARAVISAALDVLAEPDDRAPVKVLRTQLVQLSEIVLLLDGQLSEDRVLPPDVSPWALRRWVVDVEIGMDELVSAVLNYTEIAHQQPFTLTRRVREVLQAVGWADSDRAAALALQLADDPDAPAPARQLGRGADFLIDTVARWTSGELLQPATGEAKAALSEFESVLALRAGRLPGTAPLAEKAVKDADAPAWSPARLRLTTRQAVQASVAAALAIWIGHLISPQRYYWAVIAAFIAFTGTATASDTVRRSLGRVVGTTLGLLAAVGLSGLTAGHTPWTYVVLLISLGLAWYLFPISYGAMIFFLTVALGQLYGLLHEFTDQVLELRLAETVAGALIGAVVGLLVLPASAMRTLRVARVELLGHLADLLDSCRDLVLRGGGIPPVADRRAVTAQVVQLDADARQLVQAVQSLVTGRFFSSDRSGMRHRVAVLGSAAAAARAVASLVNRGYPRGTETDIDRPAYAAAMRELATESHRLASVPELENATAPEQQDIAARVGELLDPAVRGPARTAPLRHQLKRLADSLSLLTPRGRP